MPLDAAMADLAALVATALAAVAVVPQLRRILVAGDARGVSMAAALLVGLGAAGVAAGTAMVARKASVRNRAPVAVAR